MSSRTRSLAPTYFLSTYLVLIVPDSGGDTGMSKLKPQLFKSSAVDAQELSDGGVVLSAGRVMIS